MRCKVLGLGKQGGDLKVSAVRLGARKVELRALGNCGKYGLGLKTYLKLGAASTHRELGLCGYIKTRCRV